MEEIGRIKRVDGEQAVVNIVRQSACSKCDKKCQLAAPSHETDEIEVRVRNTVGADKGQMVKLEMEVGSLVTASLIVYLLPLLSLIAGYFMGIWFAPRLGYQAGEVQGIVGSIVLMGISFVVIRWLDRGFSMKTKYHPRIKEILY